MKKALIYILFSMFSVFLFVAARAPQPAAQAAPEDLELGWPDDVMALLEQSCFDCHTSESGNLKAKQKLNFSKWQDYKLSKQVGKLSDISDEVKEGKMPPEKYINKNPDKAFSQEDIELIVKWANAESEKLIGE